jgi:spore germination protein KB
MSIEKGRISVRQTVFLLVNLIFATEIEFIPAILAKFTGQDAWVSVLVTGVLGVLLGFLVISLSLRFPEKNLVEYAGEILCPWVGRALGIFLGLYLIYLCSLVIREFGDHLVTAVMPTTPLVAFSIIFVLMVVYGVYLGLEVFARVNEIIFPLFLFVILAGALLVVPEMDFRLLEPVLVHPPVSILRGTISLFAFYSEGLLVLLLFLPYLRRPEDAQKINLSVSLLLTVSIVIIVISELAVFGPAEVERMLFPTFELVKMIRIGDFLERIESFLLSFWVATVALKVMLLYYAALLSFAQSLNLKDYRPLVLPGALVLVVLSIISFPNVGYTRSFLATTWTVCGLFLHAGIPFLLYIFAVIRNKGGQAGEKTF